MTGAGKGSAQRSQTRQTQLLFTQISTSPVHEPITQHQHQQQNRVHVVSEPRTPSSSYANNNPYVLAYLQDMRSEERNDFSSINNKIDDIILSIIQLKAENESLKEENKRLWAETDLISKKTDKLEGHSR